MVTTYRYLTSKEWGMVRRDAVPRTEMLPDPEGTLHHTAGNPGHFRDAAPCFRDLNQMALNDGYDCVPYDILVHEQYLGADRLITIGEGRGPFMSAATLDRNEQTEAVCALGYFHPGHSLSEHPSPSMIEGIARGFVFGINQGWIAINPRIYGHRDNPAHPGATGCPGDFLYPHIPTIIERVQAMTQGVNVMNAFVPRLPTTAPRILDTRGPVDNFDAFKVVAGDTFSVPVPGGQGKTHAIVNIAAVHADAGGFLTAWASGDRPLSSDLNFPANQAIANCLPVPLAADGSFKVYVNVRTHLFIDLKGYYQPM